MTPVKTVPYARVLNSISLRWIKLDWTSLDGSQLSLANEAITTAVRYCYEFALWNEARQIQEITTVSNVVPWADIDNAPHFKVYDSEPRTPTSSAVEVEVVPVASGLRLTKRTLATVWVEFMPAAPDFNGLAQWVTATSYIVGDRVYFYTDAASPYYKRAFQCITAHTSAAAFATDAAKWVELIVYECMSEAVTLLALADILGNGEQERTQAADLRQQAEDKLNRNWIRTASQDI